MTPGESGTLLAMDSRYRIRSVRSHELDRLLAIDDAAGTVYAQFGIRLDLPRSHPFVQHEARRWRASIDNGRAWAAVDAADQPHAFATLSEVDGAPYLDQLSTDPAHGRRGLGRGLLEHVKRAAGSRTLWLTTYAHLPFNAPFYAKHGFSIIDSQRAGPEIRALLRDQRRYLPDPHERVVMVRKSDRPFPRSGG